MVHSGFQAWLGQVWGWLRFKYWNGLVLVYGGLLGVGSGVQGWFRVSLELFLAAVVFRWDGLVLVWCVWGGRGRLVSCLVWVC